MTVSEASAARYTDPHVLATYLHAEWGDLLTPGIRHFPGEDGGLSELVRPGHFYRRVAGLVADWVGRAGAAPLTACDVGGGTGRTGYELARRIPGLVELAVAEPSGSFTSWAHRLLVAPPRAIDLPTPGRMGDPGRVHVPADRLPRPPIPLRVIDADAETLAAAGERFDLVTSFNVLDRVPDPVAFAAALGELVDEGGLLVMACPFEFGAQYSPPETWVSDLRDVVPGDAYEILEVVDVPYTFKEYDRGFSWYLTQVLAARRR